MGFCPGLLSGRRGGWQAGRRADGNGSWQAAPAQLAGQTNNHTGQKKGFLTFSRLVHSHLRGCQGTLAGEVVQTWKTSNALTPTWDKAAFHWGWGIIAVNCIELGECDRGKHCNTYSVCRC